MKTMTDKLIINKPGIYNIPEDVYHSDPCVEPSLSSSMAKSIVTSSPLHAWYSSQRLNPAFEREEKSAFDLGKACHTLLLNDGADIVEIKADDFKTKAAQEARDAARAAGKTPLLSKQLADAKAMAYSARRQLKNHEDGCHFLGAGKSEESVFVRDSDTGIWCRARYDRITANRSIIFDYKTAGQTAHPDEFMRQMFRLGYDIQHAHYTRAEKALHGHEPHLFFIVQETKAPFALSVIGLTPAAQDLGIMKRRYAVDWFQWCIEHNTWPAYPNRTCYTDAPVYERQKWLDEEGEPLTSTREEMKEWFKLAEQAQAPSIKEPAE